MDSWAGHDFRISGTILAQYWSMFEFLVYQLVHVNRTAAVYMWAVNFLEFSARNRLANDTIGVALAEAYPMMDRIKI